MSPYFLCLSFVVIANMYPERADEAVALYNNLAAEDNQ